jgi:uncharacterized protein YndB with AHSA1/START domain
MEMSKNLSNEISVQQIFRAPVQQVWDAISTPRGFSNWFQFMPGFKATKGSTIHFIDPNGNEYTCKVNESIPYHKLRFQVNGCSNESVKTKLVFELMQEQETVTILRVFISSTNTIASHNHAIWTKRIKKNLRNYVEHHSKAPMPAN